MSSDLQSEKVTGTSMTADRKGELVRTLADACVSHIEKMHEDDLDGAISGLVLYCASGCEMFGVSATSRETIAAKLRGHPDLSEAYVTMNDFEWEYVNTHYEVFNEANELLDEIHDGLDYDDGMNDEEIAQFLEGVCIEVIDRLKESGALLDPMFDRDPLLGLQFPDPSVRGIEMMRNVSKAVNSPAWHARVAENCKRLLEEDAVD